MIFVSKLVLRFNTMVTVLFVFVNFMVTAMFVFILIVHWFIVANIVKYFTI